MSDPLRRESQRLTGRQDRPAGEHSSSRRGNAPEGDDASPQDPLKQLEIHVARELEALALVVAAAVDLAEPKRVRAVYLAATAGASAPELRARALEVMARHGLVCRPETIAVAVTPAPTPPPGPLPGRGRLLLFAGLDLKRASHHVTCRVQLIHGEHTLVSEVRELDTDGGGARAAARATLLAAEQAVEGVRFGLEGAATLDLFGRRHVAVSVEAADAAGVRRVARLYGLAVVERSAEDAACLAILGAIERWLNGPRSRRPREPDASEGR